MVLSQNELIFIVSIGYKDKEDDSQKKDKEDELVKASTWVPI